MPDRERAVEAVGGEEVDVRRDRGLVERARVGSGVSAAAMAPRNMGALYALTCGEPPVERDGAVLRITLTRPDRRNAFDAALIARAREAFVNFGRARAVVLAGEGASFCAGADVDWMRASAGSRSTRTSPTRTRCGTCSRRSTSCPAPVVARVQGHALGGGAGLVAAADIAIAAPTACSRSRR